MNPLELYAENYRSFQILHVEFPDGLTAITGDNGAGKSSIVNAIELCLFGGRLGTQVNEDERAMRILFAFEHGGAEYKIIRDYDAIGRGKTTLTLERHRDGGFEGLTRSSAKETQQLIEETIGFTRATWRASSFLAQGDGGAFTEAEPRDRKAVLAEAVLGRNPVWPRLLELVRQDKRALEHDQVAGSAAVDRAQVELEQLAGVEFNMHVASREASELLGALAEILARRDEVGGRLAALEEAHRTSEALAERRNTALALLEMLEAMQKVGREAEAELPLLDEQIAEAETAAKVCFQIQANERQYDKDQAAWLQAANEKLRLQDEVDTALAAANQAVEKMRALAHAPDPTCVACGQVLANQEAFDRLTETLDAEATAANGKSRELITSLEAITVPIRPTKPAPPTEEMLGADRLAATLIEQRKQLAELVAQADSKKEELHAAQAELDEVARTPVPEFDGDRYQALRVELDQTKEAEGHAREDLDAARQAYAVSEAELERLRALERRTEEDRAELERIAGEISLFATLERAYSQNGIPALLIESTAIPQIEAEANRVLGELGGAAIGVQLHTLRDLKSGDGLADTLDVVVSTETGQRLYETFSGGERSRVNIALRVALAALLAARRGAESQLLVIDEPDGLDQGGFAALLGVLEGLTAFSKILVVSHHPDLRDAIEQTIPLEKVDGVSRVVADEEVVPA